MNEKTTGAIINLTNNVCECTQKKGTVFMKGWLFTKTHDPLVLIEKPDPVAGPKQVVVDIKASGLCHSDVSAMEHESWMGLIRGAPLLLGHECAGVVESVGEEVTSVKPGDRVGVYLFSDRAANESIGYTRDGGYATKILIEESQCVHMPDEVTFEQGAAATDAGQTSYHAIFTVGGAKAGMKVGIVGIGGLGQFALGMALARGCDCYAVDVNPEARELAKEMGCEHVYENVIDLKEVAPEVIVDYAGFSTTTSDAIKAVAVGGTVVLVGMAKDDVLIKDATALDGLIIKEVQLKGSMGGLPSDIEGVYDIFKTGRFNPMLSTIPFEEIDKGLEMLKRGEVKGRLIAVQD